MMFAITEKLFFFANIVDLNSSIYLGLQCQPKKIIYKQVILILFGIADASIFIGLLCMTLALKYSYMCPL